MSDININGLPFLVNLEPCNVVDNEFVPKIPGVLGDELSDGQAFLAQANALEQSEIPAKIAVMHDGSQISHLDFSASDFTLDKLFDFQTEQFDFFIFKDASITLKTVGQEETEDQEDEQNVLVFNGKLDMDKEPLSVFKQFLNTDAEIFMQGEIGLNSVDLTKKIKPTFAVLTTGATMYVPILENVVLKSAAFQLAIEDFYSIVNMQEHWSMKITPSVMGELEISNLSKTPFALDCYGSYEEGTVHLGASCYEIENFMNVEGLNIDYLIASMNIGNENELSLSTELTVGEQTYCFDGVLGAKYAGVYAQAENFTLSDLNELFHKITGEDLILPEFDVKFDEVGLGVATTDCNVGQVFLNKGLTLKCNLSVHDFECGVDAVISSDGVSIKGFMGGLKVGALDIEEAELNLDIYSRSSCKSSSFSISGKVTIQGVRLDCRVSYEKIEKKWNLVVYAGIEAKAFGLGTIFPEFKNTFADSLKFSKLAFIYSSEDAETQDESFKFEVKRGLQLMGVLEEIPALSALTGSNNSGFVFSAHLGSTVDFSIQIPAMQLNLGDAISCDPFLINLTIAPIPAFQLIFGMDIKIPNQEIPLHFDIALDINAIEAKASATMKNWWENPFGISDLKIGPAVSLQIGIVYSQFMATGLPSEFGIAGGLAMGETVINMAVKISENPADMILLGSLSKLETKDLLSFTKALTHVDVPSELVPEFEIRDLEVYCAPSGGTIGTITFEPGFSFSGVLTIFEKSASLYAKFTDSGFLANGEIDNLDLGILKINGYNDDKASFDIELTEDRQIVYVDGAFEFLGINTAVNADISKEKIQFVFKQKFLDSVEFTVTGNSSGSLSDLDSLDFYLYAEANNDMAESVRNKLTENFNAAVKNVDISIDEAQKKLDAAKEAYDALYLPAIEKLNKAQEAADKYLDECVFAVRVEREKFNSELKNLEENVQNAQAAFNHVVQQAEKAVNEAKEKLNSTTKSAEENVAKVQKEFDANMKTARENVEKAEKAYNHVFEEADKKLKAAQEHVNSLQNEIDLNWNIYKNLSWYEYIYKSEYYLAKIGGLELAMISATAFLDSCRSFLQGCVNWSEYIVWSKAKQVLSEVESEGDALLNSAKEALKKAEAEGNALLESANNALEEVKRGNEFNVWQAALQALESFRMEGDKLLKAAEDALDNIVRSEAYIALEHAKQALEAVKNGSEFLIFETAKAELEAARHGAEAVLKLSQRILEHGENFIVIKHLKMAASLQEIKQGKMFYAKTIIDILGHEFELAFELDLHNIEESLHNLFALAFNEAKSIA